MGWHYPLQPAIDLHVTGRVRPEDAQRQTHTARVLLERLEHQPGVILADEVGMGKTFVALAVAASVALGPGRRPGPVVVMCPPGVLEKWHRDAQVFRERCLPEPLARHFRIGKAEYPVPFLKLLDDPPERRCAMVLVPHGLFNRRVRDVFTRYALLRQALLWNRDRGLKRAVARFAPRLLRCEHLRIPPAVWEALLDAPPARWLKVLTRAGHAPADNDDPVPEAVVEVLQRIDLSPLQALLASMPRRHSKTLNRRLQAIRRALSDELLRIWGACLNGMHLKLPLLIMDEAHHLRHGGTRLAGLFQEQDEETPARRFAQGALTQVFERMLFLTATPFQLGHEELCHVLERFASIRWSGERAPPGGMHEHREHIDRLRDLLDAARIAAVALEDKWGTLEPARVLQAGSLDDDWRSTLERMAGDYPLAGEVLARFDDARHALHQAQTALRPWVVRHVRPQHLAPGGPPRRRRFTGDALRAEPQGTGDVHGPGLEVRAGHTLPFLLANRMAALKDARAPVFAEGLASSYEAFLDTRRDETSELPLHTQSAEDRLRWYQSHINNTVRNREALSAEAHPKLGPVIDLAMTLWTRGEKVLIFCHYVETGKALRRHLSRRVLEWVDETALQQLRCPAGELERRLRNIGDHFDPGRPVRRALAEIVAGMVRNHPALAEDPDHPKRIEEILARFLRTPTFLLRYTDLSRPLNPRWLHEAFEHPGASGLQLRALVDNFCAHLGERCGSEERREYLEALGRIQTGFHTDTSGFAEDERAAAHRLVANVRLVNGGSKPESRRLVMLAFNTPFYPEILIGSSVMAESVDLQMACRHVIHHDLDWNPSVLEQRTGRIDRIGAKAELSGRPIHVYFPYIGGTQDEKKYRVVTDREQWFGITMGGARPPASGLEAERLAARLPLPQAIVSALTLDLGVWPVCQSGSQ